MAVMAGKVCPNHPKTSAVSRCVSCFKPLCTKCILERQKQDFCSEACATNYFTTNKSITEFRDQESRQKFFRLIKKLVVLAILIVIGTLAYRYWVNNKEKVKETTDQLKNKAEGLKQSMDDKLKK